MRWNNPITTWSLAKIHKTATKISRSFKSPWTQGFWSISVLFGDPFFGVVFHLARWIEILRTGCIAPRSPSLPWLGDGAWSLPWSAASEHRSCAKIDSLHHPHKLPLVEETVVVSIENAQQEADLLFLGNDLWKVREGQGSHQIGEALIHWPNLTLQSGPPEIVLIQLGGCGGSISPVG